MRAPVIIGIAGGSASGKTTIAYRLKEAFAEENAVIVRMDDYYKDQAEKTMEERVQTNYDHPFAFDTDLLIQQLEELMAGRDVLQPTYDFVHHTRSDKTRLLHSCDVIILEGLFVLEDERLRNHCDIKVFVDTDPDVRFIRRLVRDVKERGRSLDSVVSQWMNTVRVMHNAFVEPSKRYADLIVPEGGSNEVAIDILLTKIGSIIRENMIE